MAAEHPEFDCLDCGVSTWDTDEFYMVHDELWHRAVPGGAGMLCIRCLEDRLGHRLDTSHFLPRTMNKHLYRPESTTNTAMAG